MSGQEDFLQALDAELVGAMVDAGLGADAVYTDASRVATPCQVLVDHGVQFFGDDPSGIVGVRTVVRLQLTEIAAPERGAQLVVGNRTYLLDKPIDLEPGVSARWVVNHG